MPTVGMRNPRLVNYTRILAVLACVLFMATGFRNGWITSTSDFPNVYAPARAFLNGDRLRDYYDWTWFAAAMNRAEAGDHLGAYCPNPPLAILPMLPIAPLPIQTAKRMWLVVNLGLLGITLFLLARIGRFTVAWVVLLAFCGFASFYVDFALGQYYVVILFLLTLALFCLEEGRPYVAGACCALAFCLKLYGGPFFLYFAFRRNWRALGGMVLAGLLLLAVAIGMFGYADVWWYATHVLPRTLEGGSIDPYNPANATLSTLLRRQFMFEAELNPHPLVNAPGLFFFLRTLVLLALLVFALFALGGNRELSERHAFAWFTIVMLLLSTNTARYTFLILLLPVAVLLEKRVLRNVALIGAFVLLSLPLPFGTLFPKVWILLFLYGSVGMEFWRRPRPTWVLATTAALVLVAGIDASVHQRAYAREPGRRFTPFASEKGQIFSSFPVVTTSGVLFQAMDSRRYALGWVHGSAMEKVRFEGNVLFPRTAGRDGPVQFDLAAHGTSTAMEFDPRTRATAPAASRAVRTDVATSPDGRWVAFVSSGGGPQHLLLRDARSGEVRPFAEGNCNSSSPAWELDSKALIFASDCDRAYGTPALYRATLEEMLRIPAE